jgi:hypothetical protein
MKRFTMLVGKVPLIISLMLVWNSLVELQEEGQLQISLSRDWGYSSGTGKIQGTFSIRTSGPEDLNRVVFFLDGQTLGEVDEPPFTLRFNTDDYPTGLHQITAAGFTDAGAELASDLIRVEFVTEREGWQFVVNLIVPIAVIILLAVGLSLGIPLIASRGKKERLAPGVPSNYGYFGGAICPKCQRPFSRHIYGLNLGTHKLDRCPYCGKWSLVRRASKEELEAAEAAEIEAAQGGVFAPNISEEERLRQQLDGSRFEN